MINKIDDQEQYTRRNCLLLHGIPEDKEEDTDELVLKTLKDDLALQIDEKELDRTHRIGKPRKAGENPRPIIVKFSRYNLRRKVFTNKKRLKGKKIMITESLTSRRMSLYKSAKELFGYKNVWTSDGKILYKEGNRVLVYEQ